MTFEEKYGVSHGKAARYTLLAGSLLFLFTYLNFCKPDRKEQAIAENQKRIETELKRNEALGESGCFSFEANGVDYKVLLPTQGAFVSDPNRRGIIFTREFGYAAPDTSFVSETVYIGKDYFGKEYKTGSSLELCLKDSNWRFIEDLDSDFRRRVESELETSLPSSSDSLERELINTYYLFWPKDAINKVTDGGYAIVAKNVEGKEVFHSIMVFDYSYFFDYSSMTEEQIKFTQTQIISSGIIDALTAHNDSLESEVSKMVADKSKADCRYFMNSWR